MADASTMELKAPPADGPRAGDCPQQPFAQAMTEPKVQLLKLSERLVATELGVAFRMVEAAKYAETRHDVTAHLEALRRAKRCSDWLLKFFHDVPHGRLPELQSKFDQLRAAIGRLDAIRVARQDERDARPSGGKHSERVSADAIEQSRLTLTRQAVSNSLE